ncbi:TrmB family transcriptional regulator [Natranaeroarchaeum sulfidigenes]|nr:TrmB family transcriptional regulator [Natranaeroarchaeum sulfidigenes]
MTVTSRSAEAEVEPLPEELESAQAKLVYLCLRQFENGATVDQIQSQVGITKLALHSLLRSLSGKGYVRCEDGCYYPVRSD